MDKWRVLFSSKYDDYLTPRWLFNIIVKHYGVFDLDPACDPGNHLRIPTCYTVEDDGLSREWFGNVFVNPPYSRVYEYIVKALNELGSGRVEQVVFLVPARTDTRWFHRAINSRYFCELIFIKGRVRFEGTKTSAPFPSILLILRRECNTRRLGVLDGGIKYI